VYERDVEERLIASRELSNPALGEHQRFGQGSIGPPKCSAGVNEQSEAATVCR
jgi:hypothetical protein